VTNFGCIAMAPVFPVEEAILPHYIGLRIKKQAPRLSPGKSGLPLKSD
jgi:hypothetical protein